jgi:hypothetical protein
VNSGPNRVVVGDNEEQIWRYEVSTNILEVLTNSEVAPGIVVVNDLGEIDTHLKNSGRKKPIYGVGIHDPITGLWGHVSTDYEIPVAINNAGQICGRKAWVYDPVGGFWPINDLLDDSQADLDQWFAGTSQRLRGMAQAAVRAYPMIAGYQTGGGTVRGFVLIPKP